MRRALAVLTGLCLMIVAAACGERGQPSSAPPASPSASSERPAAGDHQLTLRHNGLDRTYLLHAPPGYDPGRPSALVIALHFYPGLGSSMRELAGLDARADTDNVLVAYPDGRGGGFNALICCGSEDDVGFLNALTDHLVQTWHADPNRVFLTGISNGGDMSFRAAVESTGTFAAIGVVSGGYSGNLTTADSYVPKSPVSVITFIGGQDRYASTFQPEGVRGAGCDAHGGGLRGRQRGQRLHDRRHGSQLAGSDIGPTRRILRGVVRHRPDVGVLRRPPPQSLTYRRSSIRVLPSVFGLTRSRSRNSATPSSYERSNCS
ncbi:alpha/beta hydrolase family esterase [Micromonospora sp. NPDC047762]|uniref:alpha/beta hydrolase family esterase n=1 Tax=Micromonospora sp. NPDC047762 TaxID=3364255 RepID=UPI003718D4B9